MFVATVFTSYLLSVIADQYVDCLLDAIIPKNIDVNGTKMPANRRPESAYKIILEKKNLL